MYPKVWRLAPVSLMVAAILVTSAGCSGGSPASPTAAPAAAAASKPAATQPAAAQPAPTAVAAPKSAPPAATAAAPTAPAKAAAPSIATTLGKEYSFTLVTTMTGQPAQTSKLAFKNGKVRVESAAAGQQVVMIADPANKVAYMVMASQKQVLKVPYEQFQSQESSAVSDPGAIAADLAGASVVGSETIDGHNCDIYSVTVSGATAKIWIAKDTSFPLKAETTVGGQTATVQYQDFKVGGLDDSLFQPPAGMPVTDMSSFSGQMPNIPVTPATKP